MKYKNIKIGEQYKESLKNKDKFYISEGEGSNIVSCSRENDFVIIKKINQTILLIEKEWMVKLEEAFKSANITINEKYNDRIVTKNS